MEYYIYKGKANDKKEFAIGFGGPNSKKYKHLPHITITYSKLMQPAKIIDGWVIMPNGVEIPVDNIKTGEPVSALEMLDALVDVNHRCVGETARGLVYTFTHGINNGWFIDYKPELEEFFTKHRLTIPEGGSVHDLVGDHMFRSMEEVESLEKRGLLKRGLGGVEIAKDAAPGAAALEAAKLKKQSEELAAQKAEIEELKKQLESQVNELQKDAEALKEAEAKQEPKATKKPKKEKVEK